MDPTVWERVGALADRAPTTADLMHHRLQLVAASRMRARGEERPAEVRHEERRCAAAYVSAPALLARIRSVCDGRLLLMKGLEVSRRWPEPRLRPFLDVDLLVDDARVAHAALLDAGFVALGEAEKYEILHHLVPLGLPGMPLSVEIHSRLHWPGQCPPPGEEIFAAAVPSLVGIEGLLAPNPAQHAVLLAAHGWAHEPLGKLGSLADVAAMTHEAGPEAAAAVARSWGVERMWNATSRAIDELLYERTPRAYRPVSRRHLRAARERSVLEGHLARFYGPMTMAPRRKAPALLLHVLGQTLSRRGDERWRVKLRRSLRAARNASQRRSSHEAGSP